MFLQKIDLEEIKKFANQQSYQTKVYIGGDSERVVINGVWYADYTTVVVFHINGKNGCKIFGEVVREKDFDQRKNRPSIRLMNEVIKTANLYISLAEILDAFEVEIHLDISDDNKYASSYIINEAIGYVRGVCNITPQIKPLAWAATTCADRYKDVFLNREG